MKYIIAMAFAMFIGLAVVKSAPASEICTINQATDVLNCALKQHPSLLQAQYQISISNINKNIADRWLTPNLELSGGYNQEEEDNKGLEMELAIMQPIETATKRQARINKAKAEVDAATTGFEGQKEITAFQVLNVLNRLRQIQKERDVLIETLKTFSDIITKYKARPTLSPEEKISLDLFQFVLNSYQLEKNQLATEEKTYINNLKSILNIPFSANEKIFYYPPRVWPSIKASSTIENSADLLQEQVNIKRAKADVLEAKASSFGGLSIGPYLQTRPGDAGRINAYGLRISAPLPFYSNLKSVAAGNLAVQAAEQNYEAKKNELMNNLAGLQEQYILGVSALKQYDVDSIHDKHIRTEELFKTGRVSGALLIEAHRQMLDGIKIYHQYELETLQSLWRIYALQRKLLTNLNEVCYEK
jgi:outer membrane protein TolC